jgi:hypothetical protein
VYRDAQTRHRSRSWKESTHIWVAHPRCDAVHRPSRLSRVMSLRCVPATHTMCSSLTIAINSQFTDPSPIASHSVLLNHKCNRASTYHLIQSHAQSSTRKSSYFSTLSSASMLASACSVHHPLTRIAEQRQMLGPDRPTRDPARTRMLRRPP